MLITCLRGIVVKASTSSGGEPGFSYQRKHPGDGKHWRTKWLPCQTPGVGGEPSGYPALHLVLVENQVATLPYIWCWWRTKWQSCPTSGVGGEPSGYPALHLVLVENQVATLPYTWCWWRTKWLPCQTPGVGGSVLWF